MNEQLKLLLNRKEIRFLFVGGINTVVGFGVYALCIFFGLHYALAQLCSAIIGVANSYLWNKYFTFRKKDKSAGEFFRFIMVYVMSYLINLGLLYVLIDKLNMSEYLAGIFTLIVITLVSYFGHNKFSFKEK